MTGVGGMAFLPHGTTTRAEIVTILYRMAGSPTVTDNGLPFTDVNADTWYRDALVWAYQLGVAKGVSDTSFAGSQYVTRQELAAFLQRYVTLVQKESATATASLSKYTDAGKVSSWAQDAVKWAVGTGIIQGTSDTTLSPLSNASRVETAQMLTRFLSN
jgi:hypothetical protein